MIESWIRKAVDKQILDSESEIEVVLQEHEQKLIEKREAAKIKEAHKRTNKSLARSRKRRPSASINQEPSPFTKLRGARAYVGRSVGIIRSSLGKGHRPERKTCMSLQTGSTMFIGFERVQNKCESTTAAQAAINGDGLASSVGAICVRNTHGFALGDQNRFAKVFLQNRNFATILQR